MHKEEKSFVKKKEKLAASQVEKVTKKGKFIKCYRQISIRVRERISSTKKETSQNTLLMPSLRDGNAIENLLMTAQINTDFVSHPVPSTTESSTSHVRVGTDACESIINSILYVTKTMISIKMRGHSSLVVKVSDHEFEPSAT
ncbi:uncharacterized protein TNCV_4521231 [Trichonephila clavipes]|nr:uncharacterized protein TNCV_4521231 [Trichonephila clavipes]